MKAMARCRRKRINAVTNEYYCCGWTGPVEDLVEECLFVGRLHGDPPEPPEYVHCCPSCGQYTGIELFFEEEDDEST